jgi:hypothetical protein
MNGPISEKRSMTPVGRLLLTLLGIILLIAGMAGFWFITLQPAINVLRARQWPATACRIVSSELQRHDSDEGTSWSAEISFDYEVDNRRWRSDRWSFFNVSGSRQAASRIVDANPVGHQTVCFYDPRNPQVAVIDRRFQWWSLLGLLFLLLSVAGGFIATRGRHRSPSLARRHSSTPLLDSSSAVTDDDELFAPRWDGPLKLKPESTRLGRLIGLMVVALIWNGILGIFLYQAVGGRGGGLDVCFSLFLVPFVVIGLVLLIGVVHQLLGLANPVVEIALSNGMVAPGDELDVAWECQGRTGRIRQLTLVIEGIEQARYTRGTDTFTDEETFCTIQVAEVSEPAEIQFGSRSIRIPQQTIPSFEAPHNKVLWKIRVNGDIPRWPDIKEEFPFRVKPS